MKRVIISGATGSVGMALVQELIQHDIEVLIFCREGSMHNERIPMHPQVTLKYCSLNQMESVANDTGKNYDVFYHFAWDGTTGEARNNMYLQNMNVKYSLDAVGAAHRFGCQTFIGAGSQAEYGRVEGTLKSDTPVFPESGYGIGKLCAGYMTKEYSHQFGMKHLWIRILSVYGPHDYEQSMIMSMILKLKQGITPQFTKGEQMWDYLCSDDAAVAFRLLGESGVDAKTYVLGSGIARPLADYIKDIHDIVNKDVKVELGTLPYEERQVMYLCADINELTKDVNWRPMVQFTTGIKKLVERMRL